MGLSLAEYDFLLLVIFRVFPLFVMAVESTNVHSCVGGRIDDLCWPQCCRAFVDIFDCNVSNFESYFKDGMQMCLPRIHLDALTHIYCNVIRIIVCFSQ